MSDRPGSIDLKSLLDKLARAGNDQDQVAVRDLLDAIGRRSFAPILLLASVLGFTPLGGVPTVPTTLAVIIVFIAGQIVLGFDRLWLPNVLLRRRIKRSNLDKAVNFLKPAAAAVDKVIRPRLTFLTDRPYSYLIAFVCVLLAFAVPPLELVPFVDIPLWGAITAFSLALAAHDGVLAIVAFLLTAVSVYAIAATLL
jgi:hypothetical protein